MIADHIRLLNVLLGRRQG